MEMHFQPTLFLSIFIVLILSKSSQVSGIIGDDGSVHINTICAVVLKEADRFICTGSLVFDDVYFQFVLTSAKCLWNGGNKPNSHYPAGHLKVYGHTTHFEQNEGILRKVRKVVIHPGFDPRFLNHDLAILFLDEPYDFVTGEFTPCRMPKPGNKLSGGVVMMGYGAHSFDYETDGSLGKIVLPFVNHEICKSFGHDLKDGRFCVGWLGKGGTGPCDGDEGGPTLGRHALEKSYYLAGIYSHTPAYGTKLRATCADPRVPSIVTDIASHMDWIAEQIQKRNEPDK